MGRAPPKFTPPLCCMQMRSIVGFVLLGAAAVACSNANASTCGSPEIADQAWVVNRRCSWEIEGSLLVGTEQQVADGSAKEIATFIDDCKAWNPSDLIFANAEETQFLTTDQKTLTLFGDVFRLRDCEGKVFATAKEDIFSWGGGRGVKYNVYDNDDEVFLRSRSGSFWDARLEWEDAEGHFVGVALMEWSERMAAGWFCNGGKWDLWFNATTPQLYREIIVALASIKSVRDQTRDREGNVTGSWCHSFWKFLIIGVPLIAFGCLVSCYNHCREKRASGDSGGGQSAARAAVRFVSKHSSPAEPVVVSAVPVTGAGRV